MEDKKNVTFSIKEEENGHMSFTIEANLNAAEAKEFAEHARDLDREILDIGYNTDKSKAWFFDKLRIKDLSYHFWSMCNKKPLSSFYIKMDEIFDFGSIKGLQIEQNSAHELFLETKRGTPMWLTETQKPMWVAESQKSPYVSLLIMNGPISEAMPIERCREAYITRAETDPDARKIIWTYVQYARNVAKTEELADIPEKKEES